MKDINPPPPTENKPPTIANPGPQTGTDGDRVALRLVASDPEGGALRYAADGLPRALSIDPETGVISGTLSGAQSKTVTARATDSVNNVASTTFAWTVKAKPPDRPTPTSPYLHHKGVTMASLDGKKVVLRGPGGMLLRPDAPNTGIWANAQPPGWRGSIFDGADSRDSRYHYVAKAVGNRYTFANVADNCLAGEDGGQYSGGLGSQVYHKPSGNTDAGDLEQWRVYDGNQNGGLEAQCEHTTDRQHPSGAGKSYFAYPLAVEVI
jgi:Putative Ig domain